MPQQTPTGRKRSRAQQDDQRWLWWYGGGFSLLGLLIGLTAGLSESPVAAVLIPLLFALISGGGAFYFARADISTGQSKHRMAVLGKMLSLFCLLALAGLLYGALLRTDTSVAALVPELYRTEPKQSGDIAFAGLDAEGALELSALRFRLLSLGLPGGKVDEILQVAGDEWRQRIDHTAIKRTVKAVSTAANKAEQLFPHVDEEILDEYSQANFQQLRDTVMRISLQYGNLSILSETAPLSEPQMLTDALREDHKKLGFLVDNEEDDAKWQLNYPDFRRALLELEVRLDQPFTKLEKVPWRSGELAVSDIDELIRSLVQKESLPTQPRSLSPGRRLSIRP